MNQDGTDKAQALKCTGCPRSGMSLAGGGVTCGSCGSRVVFVPQSEIL